MSLAEKLCYLIFTNAVDPRQQEVYDYSCSEDMSLGEIAETLGISRQAVHDNLRRTEKNFGRI